MFKRFEARCVLILANRHIEHAEHMGLVAYATAEALKLDLMLHVCVYWLVVSGVWTVLTRDLRRRER